MAMARRRQAELIETVDLSPSVRSLSFRLRDGAPVGHVAGQHLDLIVPTPGGLAFRRAYSIASAPDAHRPEAFEIAVTRVEGGPTSSALHGLAPGAVVEVEGPKGTFVRSDDDRRHPALFVATGTGLAPIRAMLAEEALRLDGPPLVLLFGCRTPADRLWEAELRAIERACPRIAVHVTFSRPPPGWQGRSGYVQRHVAELADALWESRERPDGPSRPEGRAYVCGLSAMVDDVVKLLDGHGAARDRVRYELYD
jgi:ferredoxin-NADP reductase